MCRKEGVLGCLGMYGYPRDHGAAQPQPPGQRPPLRQRLRPAINGGKKGLHSPNSVVDI